MMSAETSEEERGCRLRAAIGDLMDIEKHYQRKEHLLFTCIERHGITGPGKVMWAKDDEVRGLLKALGKAAAAMGPTVRELRQAAESPALKALLAVEGMIDKEEHILLPMSLQTLTAEEWGEIWQQSGRYGWCLVEPREGYVPPPTALAAEGTEDAGAIHGGEVVLPKGEYLGTLEVTQDLAPLRALQGERRLLEYGGPGRMPAA